MLPEALKRTELDQAFESPVARAGPERQQLEDELLGAVFGSPLLLEDLL